MKIMGLQQDGKLVFLAFDSEIDYPSFDKNLPDSRWIALSRQDKVQTLQELNSYLPKPLADDKGRYRYVLADDGTVTERPAADIEAEPADPDYLPPSAEAPPAVPTDADARLASLESAVTTLAAAYMQPQSRVQLTQEQAALLRQLADADEPPQATV